ncbi:3',5'-cyclic-AMP phosphodiesterase [Oculatella sp. LEGE 06141]|uniref:3',5'-cyclic-AMP phosphodiesterase n=1 Tax=Oculatella sp. LEGE 06141 TaxID=1828648 RepID=UPI00187F6B08|nr:3',5'-cyclic-AMP phosphodiesterase [Oculatella sp. LEGE 06141]MBE9178488.1 3',5'-cyclic-AMP phosphodiesterase [Oculatella sp. LEGE 06141]
MSQSPLIVAQITDTHLFADERQTLLGISTTQSLQAVLKRLKTLHPQPNIVLLTGDLSQDETPQSYERLRDCIAPLNIPTYWIPGNHDRPHTMQSILNTGCISAEKSVQVQGWRFLLLNSAVPGQVHGQLSEDTLTWLNQELQQHPTTPTVVALHHSPRPIASDWMDDINLHQPEALFAVLDRHPQVKTVLFGHIHQEFADQRQGVRYFGCPSTCVQFKPKHSDFAVAQEGPGFRLLELHPDGSYSTTVERVAYSAELDLTASGY